MPLRIFIGLLLFILLPGVLPAQVDSFIVAGVHPKASTQPTTTGKMIVTLFPWNGKLYAGYGDYGANTGPISIMSFDPGTRVFTEEFEANTEAVYNYRAIRGKVYAPAIDRKLYSIPGDYTLLDTNGIWSGQNCGSTTHAYDVVSISDSDLWIVGSKNEKAAAFRSTNDGTTWRTVLLDTAVSGIANDFARFYFAGVLGGKLYLQGRDYYGPLHPSSRVFDGSAWSDGPDLFPGAPTSVGWRPETFSGKLLYRSWQPTRSSRLFVFDGVQARWLDSMLVFDLAVDSGFVYVLIDEGQGIITVKRSGDLLNWTRILRAPEESLSLAVLAGKIYIGTKDSKILEFVPPDPTAVASHHRSVPPPTIRLYPNPVRDILYVDIEGDQETEVSLVDLLGRRLIHAGHTPRSQHRIDMREYPHGLYLLLVRSGRAIALQKVVRQ